MEQEYHINEAKRREMLLAICRGRRDYRRSIVAARCLDVVGVVIVASYIALICLNPLSFEDALVFFLAFSIFVFIPLLLARLLRTRAFWRYAYPFGAMQDATLTITDDALVYEYFKNPRGITSAFGARMERLAGGRMSTCRIAKANIAQMTFSPEGVCTIRGEGTAVEPDASDENAPLVETKKSTMEFLMAFDRDDAQAKLEAWRTS